MFYQRFVPTNTEAEVVEGPVAKKPKKSHNHESQPIQGERSAASRSESLAVERKKQKKAKKNSHNVEPNDTSHPKPFAAEPPRDEAHERILAKLRKSLARAGKLPTFEDPKPLEKEESLVVEEQHNLEPLPQPAPVEITNEVSADAGLPEWIRNPIILPPKLRAFDSFALPDKAVKALHRRDILETTPIQAAVLPLLLSGPEQHSGDLCISAATGSGKTLAYALPIVEALRNQPGPRLRGLIVVPTRELVNQAKDVLQTCCTGTSLRIGTAVGSRSLKEERGALLMSHWVYDPEAYKVWRDKPIDDLEELMKWDSESDLDGDETKPDYIKRKFSTIDILVSTPGRLVDHIRNTKDFNLHGVEFLVVDEADRLLDESFQEWLDVVLPELNYLPPIDDDLEALMWKIRAPPRRRKVRKVIVSATMTRDVGKLAGLELHEPRLVVPPREDQQHQDAADTKMAGNAATTPLYRLPSKLVEYASQGIDNQDKPLYLLELLAKYVSIPIPKNPEHPAPVSDSDYPQESDSSLSSMSISAESHNRSSPPNTQPGTSNESKRPRGTLIFTNSNESANRLSRLLELLQPQITNDLFTLTKSSRSSTQRKAIKALKTRDNIIIIATDRASRGLDIEHLARVINYEMPKNLKIYVHRVGRTARAGNGGDAFTLVADNEPGWFWNVIAKGGQVERSGKVQRMNLRPEGWTAEEKDDYQKALQKLGEDVRGY